MLHGSRDAMAGGGELLSRSKARRSVRSRAIFDQGAMARARAMQNLDTGNTGFMLLCSSLVMLMTPGLAFFYGGLVSRRNVLTIMMQSYVSMGWTTLIW